MGSLAGGGTIGGAIALRSAFCASVMPFDPIELKELRGGVDEPEK